MEGNVLRIFYANMQPPFYYALSRQEVQQIWLVAVAIVVLTFSIKIFGAKLHIIETNRLMVY